MIDFVSDLTEESWKGYLYAVAMLIGATALTFAQSHYFYFAGRAGLKVRAAIIAAVYRKVWISSISARTSLREYFVLFFQALRISSASKRSTNLGEIVNLMSVDAQRLYDFMSYINLLWSAPLMIGVSIYFLWQVLGPSALAGVVVLLATLPLNVWLARYSKQIQVSLFS
jgi:ATP-binding cassette, subfamily C (CFTR/MRP), member 1